MEHTATPGRIRALDEKRFQCIVAGKVRMPLSAAPYNIAVYALIFLEVKTKTSPSPSTTASLALAAMFRDVGGLPQGLVEKRFGPCGCAAVSCRAPWKLQLDPLSEFVGPPDTGIADGGGASPRGGLHRSMDGSRIQREVKKGNLLKDNWAGVTNTVVWEDFSARSAVPRRLVEAEAMPRVRARLSRLCNCRRAGLHVLTGLAAWERRPLWYNAVAWRGPTEGGAVRCAAPPDMAGLRFAVSPNVAKELNRWM